MGEKQPSKWKEILLKILYWVGEILTVFIAGLSVVLALSEDGCLQHGRICRWMNWCII